MELRALMDLHTHTLASGHAYSTLKENLEEAKKMGLEVLGTSEHARMMPGTAPLIYFQNFKVIPKEVDGVRLVGSRRIFLMNTAQSMWKSRSSQRWITSLQVFIRRVSQILGS